MSNELAAYKQNRVRVLQNMYNANARQIYSTVVAKIRNVQMSRSSRRLQQTYINNLIAQYYRDMSTISTAFNNSKLAIQNFTPTVIKEATRKKALLVGINYVGTQDELYGCINDVNSIKERIVQDGFSDVKVLTDLTPIKATRNNILLEFTNLLVNAQSGDLLFFSYSGHGSYIFDRNGDEADGRDEMIVSCDLRGVVDDELKALIQTHLKSDVTLFAMFDSCFSGSMLDLKYQYLDSLNYDNYTENEKQLDTPGNVLMISGCADNQTSADAFINNMARGAMTWSLLEAIKEKPICSWRELVKLMRDKLKTSEFDQIPQFSSGTFVDIDATVFI